MGERHTQTKNRGVMSMIECDHLLRGKKGRVEEKKGGRERGVCASASISLRHLYLSWEEVKRVLNRGSQTKRRKA